jgi:O-antigen/teichoic acid export membrane protein
MSRSFRSGLVILGVLSLVDVAGPLMTDGDHPPMSIAIVGSALGVASLVCVVLAWRGDSRAVLPLAVLRLLSALTAVPAFFVSDVPPAIRVLAAGLVILTLVAVALVVGARGHRVVPA